MCVYMYIKKEREREREREIHICVYMYISNYDILYYNTYCTTIQEQGLR